MRDDELEAALRDVGRHLAYPDPAHMDLAVRARIRSRRGAGAWWRRPFVPAFATLAILLLVIAFAFPGVRAAADEFLHVRGIDIFRVKTVPSPAPTPVISVPGERVTLDEARRLVHFAIRVPDALGLSAPDEVFVETAGSSSERVTLVYGERPGVPHSAVPGVSALLTELRGSVDENLLGKAAGAGTRVQPVTVNGARGFWLEGAPHLLFYRDANGSVLQDTLRLAGNTLIWEQNGVTLRLEAQLSRDQALRVAASLR